MGSFRDGVYVEHDIEQLKRDGETAQKRMDEALSGAYTSGGVAGSCAPPSRETRALEAIAMALQPMHEFFLHRGPDAHAPPPGSEEQILMTTLLLAQHYTILMVLRSTGHDVR